MEKAAQIMNSSGLYIALIHHPVVDRNKQLITSSVTNMDLHDIARSARTFGVRGYFVVHPSQDEQALNRRIVSHWHSGFGLRSHPTRTRALELVHLVHDFEAVMGQIEKETGQRPLKVGTHARKMGSGIFSIEELRAEIAQKPVLLVFGTGYGLAPQWAETLDGFLGPIEGPTDFNHLSVRSAVAIYLDRLMGLRPLTNEAPLDVIPG
jgi:hypothetical protein